jgi:DNA helicase II / ATP-dependent DNA helicase PcrA
VTGRPDDSGGLDDALERAVAGADPSELLSLCDALDDPGDLPYSRAAAERFALLSDELRLLRRHAGEPLLDLVRLIITTCGIDVELASSVSSSAAARRDNLDLFVRAVGEFQAVDGEASLAALLAYLTAEDDYGTGLDVATPTEADSVKLLTVHRAKGLEWHSVFLVGVGEKKFPTDRSRSLWTTVSWVLPAPLRGDAGDIPQLRAFTKDGLAAYKEATREAEAVEELRLGYVAMTRAAHELAVSSHWRTYRNDVIGPSRYLEVVRSAMESWGETPELWTPKPESVPPPMSEQPRPWPVTELSAEALRRIDAAEQVRAVDLSAEAERAAAADEDAALDLVTAPTVREWDDEIGRLLAEARAEQASVLEVPLPSSLSATALSRLRDDPATYAADLARPMPRPPAPAARFGTRFHAWVEGRAGQQPLLDPDELPGRADSGIEDDDDLRELIRRFEQGPFGERVPHAVEAAFSLVLRGQVVRGRIDAVYSEPGGGFLVVDWKTNRAPTADPWQLAVYRLAWSELTGTPLERVRAAFYYVRTGELVEPPGLPDRAVLENLFSD